MLRWARTQAGILKESVKYGASIKEVRAARAAVNVEADFYAKALAADPRQLRIALGRREDIAAIHTKFGHLHFRPRDTDLLVIRQVFVDGEYDIDHLPQMATIRSRYEQMLRDGKTPVIIDAGANIGAASIWFAARFPDARIVAIEPDPANAAVARLNIKSLPNASLCEAAVGASGGNVSLYALPDQGWGSRTERSAAGVPLVTIPDLLAEIPDSSLLIAKIDIEGFESDLFAENVQWVDAAVAVIIEPHDWMLPGAGTSRGLQQALVGKGREILISGENLVFV